MCSIPATFLTFICVSFLLLSPAPTGLSLDPLVGYLVGGSVALPLFVFCIIKAGKSRNML